jgi:hypothetical protein
MRIGFRQAACIGLDGRCRSTRKLEMSVICLLGHGHSRHALDFLKGPTRCEVGRVILGQVRLYCYVVVI